jgi:hypothetical protein
MNVSRRMAKKLAVTGSSLVAAIGAQTAMALDTTAVGTALTAAQGDGEAVGGMVITVVAGLVVVGIIIGLIKKA